MQPIAIWVIHLLHHAYNHNYNFNITHSLGILKSMKSNLLYMRKVLEKFHFRESFSTSRLKSRTIFCLFWGFFFLVSDFLFRDFDMELADRRQLSACPLLGSKVPWDFARSRVSTFKGRQHLLAVIEQQEVRHALPLIFQE